jgi:hypothetical protein
VTLRGSAFRYGLGAGAIVWAIFAIVQAAIAIPFAGLFPPHCCNGVVSWFDIPALVGLYAVAGALSCGLTLAAFASLPQATRSVLGVEPAITAVTLATLVGAIAIRMLGVGGAERDAFTGALATALVIGIAWSLVKSQRRVLAALTRPWPTALVLTGLHASWARPFSTQPIATRVTLAACLAAIIAYWAATIRRTRRAGVSVVLAGSALAAAVAGFGHAPFSPAPPQRTAAGKPADVVLIVLDTVRADHMSVYGYERNTTPNLKRLAGEATVYTRAFSASSHTLPSHASMFTGLYPSWHGAHYPLPPYSGNETDAPLPSRFHTLAEILTEAGYATHSIVANTPFLGDSYNLDQGFGSLSLVSAVSCGRPVLPFWPSVRDLVVRARTPFDHRRTGMGTEVTSEAIDKLDRAPSERPVFLFLNYLDAHDPRVPPSPFDRMFPGKRDAIAHNRYSLV